MLRAVTLATLGVFGVAATTAALAQQGDARHGSTVARDICGSCHAVRSGEQSPNSNAPTFAMIAAVPGMTSIALQAALQTSHRTMPNLILPDDARADVIAYILSLKSN